MRGGEEGAGVLGGEGGGGGRAPGPCPDTGGARCAVCGADFPGTRSVVEHLVREHGVRSRPPLLLTARRLQEAGYFLPGTQGDQEEPRGV